MQWGPPGISHPTQERTVVKQSFILIIVFKVLLLSFPHFGQNWDFFKQTYHREICSILQTALGHFHLKDFFPQENI